MKLSKKHYMIGGGVLATFILSFLGYKYVWPKLKTKLGMAGYMAVPLEGVDYTPINSNPALARGRGAYAGIEFTPMGSMGPYCDEFDLEHAMAVDVQSYEVDPGKAVGNMGMLSEPDFGGCPFDESW